MGGAGERAGAPMGGTRTRCRTAERVLASLCGDRGDGDFIDLLRGDRQVVHQGTGNRLRMLRGGRGTFGEDAAARWRADCLVSYIDGAVNPWFATARNCSLSDVRMLVGRPV